MVSGIVGIGKMTDYWKSLPKLNRQLDNICFNEQRPALRRVGQRPLRGDEKTEDGLEQSNRSLFFSPYESKEESRRKIDFIYPNVLYWIKIKLN